MIKTLKKYGALYTRQPSFIMANTTTINSSQTTTFGPSENMAKMPGFWVLANMGKKVLRPGGKRLTSWMLSALAFASYDKVVEFAPGVGLSAKQTLSRRPGSYIGVEKDEKSAARLRTILGIDEDNSKDKIVTGKIEDTNLDSNSATICYGEAVLTMHNNTKKRAILREAHRLLEPGGQYAVHELCFKPESILDSKIEQIVDSLTDTVRVHSQPLRMSEWEKLFEEEGFEITHRKSVPMSILRPLRMIVDEGIFGSAKFIFNVLRNREARKRILIMAKLFNKHHKHIEAFAIIARKV